jgi:tight adherence protein C
VTLQLGLLGCCFVTGGLLVAHSYLANRRPALALRLGNAESRTPMAAPQWETTLPPWLSRVEQRYQSELRSAGDEKTVRRLVAQKALLTIVAPVILALPYAAATGHLPGMPVLLLLAAGGFFVPDLVLHAEAKRRRETIFLDLPEALAILALSLRAGQSLRQALELAARDCPGPLGAELQRALTLARRERGLDEREALVRIARAAGEPIFSRFADLLAAKESPYLGFLQQQAREARAEQNRYLERAADRAYLAMHAPLAPLLAALVLLLAYGFLHFLAATV